MRLGRNGTTPRPAAPDERVMNALHKMQDYLQQIMVISQKRSQKTYTEQAASRTNGNAAYEAKKATAQARGRQEEARGFLGSAKMSRAEAEMIFNGTIKDTLAKTEALEKHVNNVNMRAEALATTEADFFKALLDRQEEAQNHLNELSAQLSQQNTTTLSTQ